MNEKIGRIVTGLINKSRKGEVYWTDAKFVMDGIASEFGDYVIETDTVLINIYRGMRDEFYFKIQNKSGGVIYEQKSEYGEEDYGLFADLFDLAKAKTMNLEIILDDIEKELNSPGMFGKDYEEELPF